MEILNRVKKEIINNKLILKGEKVLVALSGGSDSVAMLHMLYLLKDEIGFSLCAAHLNHNIRKEADMDEKFVINLCKSLNIECYTKKVDVLKIAKETSKSTELCGRELRYEFFDELKIKYSIDKIATAHNKNDSAESILQHFIRGSGPDGLSGIPVMRDNCIIRPVLNVLKTEIEEYCEINNLSFVVDKSNFEKIYSRNRIRLDLIPYIEKELNDGFVETVTSNAKVFSEISTFLENYSNRVYKDIVKNNKVFLKDLFNYDIAVLKAVLQKMYKEISKSQMNLSNKYLDIIIETLKDSKEPKTLNLPWKISLKYEQGILWFERETETIEDYEYKIVSGEELYIKECDYSVIIKPEKELKKNTKNKIYFYIDEDSVLVVRNRRKGDKFFPLGMNGTKNVSDLFCDMKMISSKRQTTPILICDEKIVWIMGIRADRRFQKGKKLMSAEILKGDI